MFRVFFVFDLFPCSFPQNLTLFSAPCFNPNGPKNRSRSPSERAPLRTLSTRPGPTRQPRGGTRRRRCAAPLSASPPPPSCAAPAEAGNRPRPRLSTPPRRADCSPSASPPPRGPLLRLEAQPAGALSPWRPLSSAGRRRPTTCRRWRRSRPRPPPPPLLLPPLLLPPKTEEPLRARGGARWHSSGPSATRSPGRQPPRLLPLLLPLLPQEAPRSQRRSRRCCSLRLLRRASLRCLRRGFAPRPSLPSALPRRRSRASIRRRTSRRCRRCWKLREGEAEAKPILRPRPLPLLLRSGARRSQRPRPRWAPWVSPRPRCCLLRSRRSAALPRTPSPAGRP